MDPEALDVRDYFEVIQDPMDLGWPFDITGLRWHAVAGMLSMNATAMTCFI